MEKKYNYETTVFEDIIKNNISSWDLAFPMLNDFKNLPYVFDDFTPKNVRDFYYFYNNEITILNSDLSNVSSPKEKEEIQKKIYTLELEKDGIDAYGTEYAYIQETNSWWDFSIDKVIDAESIPKAERSKRNRQAFKSYSDSEYRTIYKSFVFNPGGDREFSYGKRGNKTSLNKWFGWGVKNEQYSDAEYEKYIKPILYNIHYALCSGNEKQSRYLIQWLAHMVQKPNEKPGVAILLRSDMQGTGKGLFMNFISSLIHDEYYLYSPDISSITGAFNGHLDKKLFVFLDEAIWGGDKKDKSVILSMITDPKMFINNKYEKASNIDSYLRIFAASNSEYPIDVPKSDRRWFAPDMDERIAQNEEYFNIMHSLYINDKVKNIFLTYLSQIDIRKFNQRVIPRSVTKDLLKLESINNTCAVERFICALAINYDDLLSEMTTLKYYNASGAEKIHHLFSAGMDCFNASFMLEFVNKNYANRKGLQPVSIRKLSKVLTDFGLKSKNVNGRDYWIFIQKDDWRKETVRHVKLDNDFFDDCYESEKEKCQNITQTQVPASINKTMEGYAFFKNGGN